ncbi:hypothetical protein CL622_05230 [archaeon]|nr:hypothetical protein [archaeon]
MVEKKVRELLEKYNPIVFEQDIIDTYKTRDIKLSRIYYAYRATKLMHPEFGYRRLSRVMGYKDHKTVLWEKGGVPVSVKTVDWLSERDLIPLYPYDKRLGLIARILGALFADGGIFENLNAIFLSSSELSAVKEFGEDLKIIFGEGIEKNSRIIEAGEYGHSWCYQNTNRKIIRLFQVLGAPIWRKSTMKLLIPEWIFSSEELLDNFIGSLFGGDGSIPKYKFSNPNPITIGITGRDNLKENRIEFFEQIREYFIMKGIETNNLYITKWKESNIYRIPVRSTYSNFLDFYKNVPIYYCKYKKEKLKKTIKDWQKKIDKGLTLSNLRGDEI